MFNFFLRIILLSSNLIFGYAAFAQTRIRTKVPSENNSDNISDTARWKWNKNLDALSAAKYNHKVVYEDNNLRILQVICLPGAEEPVHTHKFQSVMWVTQSEHLIYYVYKYNAQQQLVKTDSIDIKPRTEEKLNIGESVEPEGPHSIKNIGTAVYIAYRIEYKKRFKK